MSGLICIAIVAAVIGPLLLKMLNEWSAKKREEQAQREHDAWLVSPEGLEHAREVAIEERKKNEDAAKRVWAQFHEQMRYSEISKMSGREFEHFLANLLLKMGYQDVALTPNQDQGADIICFSAERERIAVQAKRWKGSVGNGAVQEIMGAMIFYECSRGIIITNSRFTAAARSLASKDSRIELYDCAWLQTQVMVHFPPRIPPFNWADYERMFLIWPRQAAEQ